MAKRKESEKSAPVNLQLMDIEVYSIYLNKDITPEEGAPLGFQIGIQHKFIVSENKLMVRIDVFVKNDRTEENICNIGVAIEYWIKDLSNVLIKETDGGKARLPEKVLTYVNATSIATARGVLFMAFRGTRAASLVMPLVDMKAGIDLTATEES